MRTAKGKTLLAGAGKKVIAGIRLTTAAESGFGMIVQESTRGESERTEELTESDREVATGGAPEAPGDSTTTWVEHTALHSFEGQAGEVSITHGERLLVSSEQAPEGWVLAARAANPTVVGYVPLTYVQEVQALAADPPAPSVAEAAEAEVEAEAEARFAEAKTMTGLRSAGLAVRTYVQTGRRPSRTKAQAFAPDDLDLGTDKACTQYYSAMH